MPPHLKCSLIRNGFRNILTFSGVLASLCLALSPGAEAAPQPHGLTPRQIRSFRDRAPRPPFKERINAGKVYVCEPYCEAAATVYYNDPKKFQDGLEVEIERPEYKDKIRTGQTALDAKTPTPPTAAAAKFQNDTYPSVEPETGPFSGSPNPSEFGSSTGSAAESPVMPAGATAATAGAPTSAVMSARPAKPEEKKEIEDIELDPVSRSFSTRNPLAFLLDVQLGMTRISRSLTTAANTQTESDALGKLGPVLEINTRLPAIFSTHRHLAVVDTSFRYWGVSSETSEKSVATRESKTDHLDLNGRILLFRQSSKLGYGLMLGGRMDRFVTEPDVPQGFSSTRTNVYLGASVAWGGFNLDLKKSMLGSASDADLYRGTSVSAGFFEISSRYCRPTGTLLKLNWSACAVANLNFSSETGLGDPGRSVYTTHPQHAYLNTNIALQLSLTKVIELVMDPKEAEKSK